MANFIKENIIVRFRVSHRIISDNDTPLVNRKVRKMLEFYQIKPSVVTLLPSREWAGRGDKQDTHKDHQQNEPGVYWGMGDTFAGRLLGLPKLTKVSHRVFALLFSL